MLQIRHILVPIDWAELSNRAFQLAASLAQERDAQTICSKILGGVLVLWAYVALHPRRWWQ